MGVLTRNDERRSIAGYSTSTECKRCGETWTNDPALTVACPCCKANPDEGCVWSGRHGVTAHIARDFAAMQSGRMTRCGALTWDGRHSRHLVLICDPVVLTPPSARQLTLI